MKTLLSLLALAIALSIVNAGVSCADDTLDLDKAIKVGSGKTMVIEFTDPDCPYCRKAEEFFGKRTDVTRYIFLGSLPMHPEAPAKVEYILSAADGAAAYTAVMGGSLDGKSPQGITEKGKKLAEVHRLNAQKSGVNGMPTFIISGVIVVGLDMNRIGRFFPKE